MLVKGSPDVRSVQLLWQKENFVTNTSLELLEFVSEQGAVSFEFEVHIQNL